MKYTNLCKSTIYTHLKAKLYNTKNQYIPNVSRRLSNTLASSTKQPFTVLGIETSCDDTAAAVVTSDGQILAEIVSSQWELNAKYKGVHPLFASRAHKENLPRVITELELELNSSRGLSAVDAIAVTTGPGLEMCLDAGNTSFAKDLSNRLQVPIIPINHLEGHILVPRLVNQTFHSNKQIEFPFLVLLASGGHTELLLAKRLGCYMYVLFFFFSGKKKLNLFFRTKF
eukprot:GSMAST32.ASY1.ANO1.2806.1 assembled CDS